MKLAKGDLTKIVLKDVRQKEHQLTRIAAPEIHQLFKESVYDSLISWYSDYTPAFYSRTNNFMNVFQSAKTIVNGNLLIMQVDSSSMMDYAGWFDQILDASKAFDFMFMNGKHGHGRWMMYQSIPPFHIISKDFESGFGGRVQKIIDDKAKKLFS